MSLKRRKEQAKFSQEIERHDVGQRAVAAAQAVLEQAKILGKLTPLRSETYYPYGDSGEAPGHEQFATVMLNGAETHVRDRIFEHPETGEAVACYVIDGDEFPPDSATEGAEGPYALIFYTDDANQMLTAQAARCFIGGEMQDVPLPTREKIVSALETELAGGNLEVLSPDTT